MEKSLNEWTPERPIYCKDVTTNDESGITEIEKIGVIKNVETLGYMLEECTLKDTKAREMIGNIDTALDTILAMQAELIGGDA